MTILGIKFLPPVGESPLLSSAIAPYAVDFVFLPPVGESPLLRLYWLPLLPHDEFLPPVGESPLLSFEISQKFVELRFYPLSGNHLC